MKNKVLILIILGILLFGLGVINKSLTDSIFTIEANDEKYRADLISSGFWNLTGSPILIDGNDPSKNWSYTASHYAWCSGSGTLETPYIIENVTIDGQGVGSCIEIRNTTAYFMIKSCTVYNSGSNYLEDAGIELINVKNGQMRENNCSNNQELGILVTTNSSNVNITNNFILNMGYGGIYLLDGCYNNNISFNYGECSIMLSGGLNNIISNNDLSGYGWIRLNGNCSYNFITNNEISGSGGVGINLFSNSNYNVIKNNSIKDRTSGFGMQDCRNNIICDNIFSNIDDGSIGFTLSGGLVLENINNTLISNNTVENGNQVGIKAFGNNNTIEGNIVHDNRWYGIWALGNDNTYSKNSIVNNYMGIFANGQNLVLNDNLINLNYHYGIYLGGSCNIFGNTLTSNGWPGRAESIRIRCNNSLIWNNTLTNNFAGGINLELLCYDNEVFENNITGRGSYDDYGIKVFQSNNNNISKNILTGHCFALYLERSNYSNIFENIMTQNLKCIEEIDCVGNIYRDNSCDIEVISPAIPGFNISFLIGVMFLYTLIYGRRKFRSKH